MLVKEAPGHWYNSYLGILAVKWQTDAILKFLIQKHIIYLHFGYDIISIMFFYTLSIVVPLLPWEIELIGHYNEDKYSKCRDRSEYRLNH